MNRWLKISVFEDEENKNLLGPAALNEIYVFEGSVYGIPGDIEKFGEEGKGGDKVLTEEEKQDKRAEEIRSEGVKLGKEISYADALIQAARELENK